MRILVIGSGGREHALVRALDPGRDDIHAAPGNPGIEALAQTHPDTASTPDGILALARKLGPGLVVIGPEAPLVAGAGDALREAGIRCFGPAAAAARIEGADQGVLAPARPDDEDAHARSLPASYRSRSLICRVWSRRGPTPTAQTGAPIISSTALM